MGIAYIRPEVHQGLSLDTASGETARARFPKSLREVWIEAVYKAPMQDINDTIVQGFNRRHDVLCPGAPPLPEVSVFAAGA